LWGLRMPLGVCGHAAWRSPAAWHPARVRGAWRGGGIGEGPRLGTSGCDERASPYV
jgi:hypothetical protein